MTFGVSLKRGIISGGIVGITQNEIARARFFLISPELAKLSSDACDMAGLNRGEQFHHHDLTTATRTRQQQNVTSLKNTIQLFCNPFEYQENDIINITTKSVMSECIKNEMVT